MRIALRRTRISPCDECRDLWVRERRIVQKMSAARIGKPRRHLLRADFVGNVACLKPYLFVSNQRHRTDLSEPMASLAMILKDGQHVAVERRRAMRVVFRQLSGGEGNRQEQD